MLAKRLPLPTPKNWEEAVAYILIATFLIGAWWLANSIWTRLISKKTKDKERYDDPDVENMEEFYELLANKMKEQDALCFSCPTCQEAAKFSANPKKSDQGRVECPYGHFNKDLEFGGGRPTWWDAYKRNWPK